MCRKHLLLLYRAFFARTCRRVAFIEQWLSFQGEPPPLSLDETRNEREAYAALFSDKCRAELELLHQAAMREMRGKSYGHSGDVLEALTFLQEIVATGLWKHQCVVGVILEAFAREFDRLDVPDERKRLHGVAQQH